MPVSLQTDEPTGNPIEPTARSGKVTGNCWGSVIPLQPIAPYLSTASRKLWVLSAG
jgi:hypothetical protein